MDFKVGDKVVFCNQREHEKYPWCYPPVGTKGEVFGISADGSVHVSWPDGTTSYGHGVCYDDTYIRLAEDK